MSGKKILYICQGISPYLAESDMNMLCRQLPQLMQEQGNEIRLFTPRYGCINERRGQLHEVIRLSGMNLIIDDNDHQLIIKVASIPGARLQVYFIDNEDFFKRKAAAFDENGEPFEDNDERAIFFARGVLETVKKLRWEPDIIHCHGWMSAVAPAYVKRVFKKDPIFTNSKIVVSTYEEEKFNGMLCENVKAKLIKENLETEESDILSQPNYENFVNYAMEYADAIVQVGAENTALTKMATGRNIVNETIQYNQENLTNIYKEIYDKVSN